MSKTIGIITGIALCVTLASCEYGADDLFARKNQVDARSGHLVSADVSPAMTSISGDYTVLLMSDVHFGASDHHPSIETDGTIDKLKDWWTGLNSTDEPKFILFLGDQVESGREDQYQKFKAFADGIALHMGGGITPIPYYCVVGNHDLYNDGWRHYVTYSKPYSSAYYFAVGGFGWYFLDTASGTLGDLQLRDFKKLAKRNSGPKLAFTHYPIYGKGSDFYFSLSDPQERNKLLDIFATNNFKYVLEGHQHQGSSYNFGKFKETNISSFRDYHSWHLLKLNSVYKTVSLESWRVPSKAGVPEKFTLHDNASDNGRDWPIWR